MVSSSGRSLLRKEVLGEERSHRWEISAQILAHGQGWVTYGLGKLGNL